MTGLNLHLWTCDVGAPAASADDYVKQILSRVLESWDSGADLVVFPEFCWLGLERFMPGPDRRVALADHFWRGLWPELKESLSRPDKAVVLGSVPCGHGGPGLRNRAPIISGGAVTCQDKLHLTPGEGVFEAGDRLVVWECGGARIATLICLDVEVPELAVALRTVRPDLIVVPSATQDILGVERVNRCASARAVELGCMVAVAPLVGRGDSEPVEENIGRLALYAPSQSPFAAVERCRTSAVHESGFHCLAARIDLAAVRRLRSPDGETNPANLRPRAPEDRF